MSRTTLMHCLAVIAGLALVATAPPSVADTPPSDDCGVHGCDDEGTDVGGDESSEGLVVFAGVVTRTEGVPDDGVTPTVPPSDVPPFPCGYTPLYTGQEYFEYWEPRKDETEHQEENQLYPIPYNWPPVEQIQEHKDEGENGTGLWGVRYCRGSDYYTWDEFRQISYDWFQEAQGAVWIPNGEPPVAVHEPPVEYLMTHAIRELRVPVPQVEHNPGAKSYVNLKTWMWVDEAQADTITVTAFVRDDLWASVSVDPISLRLSSPVAEHTCPAGSLSTVYDTSRSPESQDTDCFLTFPRASTSDGWDVSATMHWEPTFASAPELADPPDFDVVEAEETFAVVVDEIQTVVGNPRN